MDKNLTSSDLFLSIVIPVYNVELYLARCLDSILKQHVDFAYEIIAVNDCSSDSSYSILKDYQEKYENIFIVNHDINKKLSIARKSGLNLCRGQYLMHVDSDDWLENNCLQEIYRIITNSYPDVAVFNYNIENSKKNRKIVNPIKGSFFATKKSEVQKYFLGAPWNKVVRKELLDDLIFGTAGINNGEDLVYSTELFFKAERILLSEFAYYVYFNNVLSLTNVNNSFNFLSNQVIVLNELSRIFQRYQPKLSQINFVINYYLDFIFLEIFNYNFKLNGKKKQEVLPVLIEICSNEIFNDTQKQELYQSIQSKRIFLGQFSKRCGIRKVISLIIK